MPYSSLSDLPAAVQARIKSPRRRRQWLHVFNSEFEAHGDESRAFASAWAAVERAGGVKPAKRSKAAGLKLPKAEAGYAALSPLGSERCSLCNMFRAPGSCTLVRGDISPLGWCKFFERKQS